MKKKFLTNSAVHSSINTWNKCHIQQQNVKLSGFQKCIHYTSIKIFYSFHEIIIVLSYVNWQGEEKNFSFSKSMRLTCCADCE